MNILALESSTMLGSVAVIQNGQVLHEITSMRQRSHSEMLNVFADECLEQCQMKLTDIDVFAAGQGPGSFTGIRVAANIAKTYSYCFNKPLVTVDSLANLAGLHSNLTDRAIMPMINAYKNMVYTAIYQMTPQGMQTLLAPCAIPVRQLKNHINTSVYAIGDGWLDYHEYFSPEVQELVHRPAQACDYPTASSLGKLGHAAAQAGQTIDWKSFVPLYIRASEAEESKNGIFITPLN